MNKPPWLFNLHDQTAGIWYAIAAYTAWGFLPLYWKLLNQVPAGEILAHRILWSFIFVSIVLFISGRWNRIKEVLSIRMNQLSILAASFLISANWFIYIWAVNNNHVIETSLGYYINPLLSIVLGMVVFKERLKFWQWVSVLFAAVGVAILTIQYGNIPWIAISLALTFALYGLTKKIAKNIDSMVALTLESHLPRLMSIASDSFG
jgi:chloramphenicol-sensitive protein RarD